MNAATSSSLMRMAALWFSAMVHSFRRRPRRAMVDGGAQDTHVWTRLRVPSSVSGTGPAGRSSREECRDPFLDIVGAEQPGMGGVAAFPRRALVAVDLVIHDRERLPHGQGRVGADAPGQRQR